eukprot:704238_1
MALSVLFWAIHLNLVRISLSSYNVIVNRSFQSASSTKLPINLFSHITAMYNNSLYVVGGLTNNFTNPMASEAIYVAESFTMDNLSNHDISFVLREDVSPYHVWEYPIWCEHQCEVQIHELLYMVQVDEEYPFILIYDMQNNVFTLSDLYYRANETVYETYVGALDLRWYINPSRSPLEPIPDVEDLINGCVVTYNGYIYIMSSQTYGGSLNYNGFVYDINNDHWNPSKYALSAMRAGIGCVTFNNDLYLFGGLSQNEEVQYIEKCDLTHAHDLTSTYLISCDLVIGVMAYPRSYCRAYETSDNYFLIYGGTSSEAKQHVEVFNPVNEQMLSDSPFSINELSIYSHSYLFVDDYLILTGGIRDDNNDIQNGLKYLDTSLLFTNNDPAFVDPCRTTYIADTNAAYLSDVNIDEYLFQNDNSELFFEVYENGDAFGFIIDSFARESLRILFDRSSDQSLRVSMSGYDNADEYLEIEHLFDELDMNMISEVTNINMLSNHSAFWMKWSPITDSNGNALTVPYWRMGFGDITDKYNIMDYASSPENQIFMGHITNVLIFGGKYHFYTDTCSLTISIVNNSFAIGDYLHVTWYLEEASSLVVPIHIKSTDIIGIDGAIEIENNSCSSCSTGISIADLATYDINNNYYEVFISSAFKNLNVVRDPIILSRIVMEVEIILSLSNSSGLYPNSYLFVTPNITNEDNPTQPNGTIIMHFDEDLSFNNDEAYIFIDFYYDICNITYNSITISCADPIVIPSGMKFKPISHNHYTVTIISNDIQLVGQTSFSFSRQIQTVSLQLDQSFYLGEIIHFSIDIIDDKIYQNTSTISVANSYYGIEYEINIKFNHGTDIYCAITTVSTKSVESCANGLSLRAFNTRTDTELHPRNFTLSVLSPDTYFNESSATNTISKTIFIENCPIGEGLVGNALTSYICQPCEWDEVNVIPNSQCIPCDGLLGIECQGSSNLIVSYNSWAAVNTIDNQYPFDLFSYESKDSMIISHFCPAGHCCQDMDGCNYIHDEANSSSLCASNRDPNTPLCGSCLKGYSEVIGSSGCKRCDKNNYWYLLFLFVIAFFMVLFVVIVDPPVPPSKTQKEVSYSTLLMKDDLRALQTCFARPLTYFFQAISYITIQTGFLFYLTPVIRLLSFDLFVIDGSDNKSGVCFVKNMNSIQKELLYLLFPFFMFLSVAMFGIFNICSKSICKRHLFGWNMFYSVFLILVGNCISNILKVLACSQIGSVMVHFYGGFLECFGFVWCIALIAMIIIIVFWIWIGLRLYKMDSKTRHSRQSSFRAITKPYGTEYWYWEIMLISRRVLIASLVTFQYFSLYTVQYVLLILLVIYFGIHIHFKPYKYKRANNMESLCMFMLILGLSSLIFGFHVSILMSIAVISPILCFVIYVIVAIKHCVDVKKMDEMSTMNTKDNNELQHRINNLMTSDRLTESQKSLFNVKGNGVNQRENTQTRTNIEMETVTQEIVSNDSNADGINMNDIYEMEGSGGVTDRDVSYKL